jgi:hypothetical protein
MSTIDTQATGRAAALQAIRALGMVVFLLNASDLGDGDKLVTRLAHQVPGSAFQCTVDALKGTLDAYLGKGRDYSERVYARMLDTGESAEECMAVIAEDVAELARQLAREDAEIELERAEAARDAAARKLSRLLDAALADATYRADRTCDYCDQPATIVDLEARETLCARDARDMYSREWRNESHRKLTVRTLATIGR